ncbi:F0F1 ATP synthase subunit A [bacterium]|nr:F0F1 ATP synthase subunit A [bacterium]
MNGFDTITHSFFQFAVTASNHVASVAEHAASNGGDEHPELANLIHMLRNGLATYGNEGLAEFLHVYENTIFFSVLVILPISIWAIRTHNQVIRGPDSEARKQIPKGFSQNFMELIVQGLSDFTEQGMGLGKRGLVFVPFIGSLFLFILLNNILGVVPLLKSSTSSLNVTVGLALIVFFTVQIHGIRELGFFGWIKHLAGIEEGSVLEYIFVPLMFPLHVLSEFIKPLSLSLRLFGNIFGEDILLAVFVGLGAFAFIPLQTPFYFLALLTSFIQTMVFTLLACSYIQSFSYVYEAH